MASECSLSLAIKGSVPFDRRARLPDTRPQIPSPRRNQIGPRFSKSLSRLGTWRRRASSTGAEAVQADHVAVAGLGLRVVVVVGRFGLVVDLGVGVGLGPGGREVEGHRDRGIDEAAEGVDFDIWVDEIGFYP